MTGARSFKTALCAFSAGQADARRHTCAADVIASVFTPRFHRPEQVMQSISHAKCARSRHHAPYAIPPPRYRHGARRLVRRDGAECHSSFQLPNADGTSVDAIQRVMHTAPAIVPRIMPPDMPRSAPGGFFTSATRYDTTMICND